MKHKVPAIRVLVVQTSPILDPEVRVLHRLLTSDGTDSRLQVALLAGVRPHEDEAARAFAALDLERLDRLQIGRLRLPRRGRLDLAVKAADRCRLSLAVRGLRSTLRGFRPDLVYSSQQRLDVGIAAALARGAGVPQVIHVHYPWGPWLGSGARRRLREVEAVIATSDFVRDGLVRAGVDPARTFTVANAMPLPPPPSFGEREEARDAVRRELRLGPDARVVLMAARVNRWKGQEDLAAAMLPILRREPDVHLVLAGEEEPAGNGALGRLRDLARSEAAGARIHLLGLRRDVPRLLLAADVFAHPSRDEAFGLSVLEAMAFEVPVVAWSQGAISEVVADGETGLLAPPGDVGALTRSLDALLGDAGLRGRLGAAGRDRVGTVYRPELAATRFSEALRAVARNGAAPG